MPLVSCLFSTVSCLGFRASSRENQADLICRSAGPRALTTVTPGLGTPGRNAPRLVLGSNEGVEWWQEVDQQWRMEQQAADPSLKSPFFSLAAEESSKVIAVGGGAGRCASIFGPDASLLATLQGHTGWVRDLLFHEGQLFSIGCNFIKVWRPQEEGDTAARWRSCAHVGDLEANGDLLALAVCGGFLFAVGASKYRHRWKLPKTLGRPKDWIAEARASLLPEPSRHLGRVTCLSCWRDRLVSCGHDGEVTLDSFGSLKQVSLGGSRLLSLAIVDKEHIAIGSEDGSIHLLNAELQTLESLQPFGPCPINGIAALPGGRFAAVSTELPGFHLGSFARVKRNGVVLRLGIFPSRFWKHGSPHRALEIFGLIFHAGVGLAIGCWGMP